MTIDELLSAAGLKANDEIPIWDAEATGEPTKKITAQQLASAVVALANLVTGVKGNAESTYRTGNVNLTPENIGAAQCILFASSDTTPALIYAKLDNLALNKPAVCRMYDATITAISGGKITNGSFGTVIRGGTNTFYFFVSKANGDKLFSFASTISASSITVGNAYQYSGTAL